MWKTAYSLCARPALIQRPLRPAASAAGLSEPTTFAFSGRVKSVAMLRNLLKNGEEADRRIRRPPHEGELSGTGIERDERRPRVRALVGRDCGAPDRHPVGAVRDAQHGLVVQEAHVHR